MTGDLIATWIAILAFPVAMVFAAAGAILQDRRDMIAERRAEHERVLAAPMDELVNDVEIQREHQARWDAGWRP